MIYLTKEAILNTVLPMMEDALDTYKDAYRKSALHANYAGRMLASDTEREQCISSMVSASKMRAHIAQVSTAIDEIKEKLVDEAIEGLHIDPTKIFGEAEAQILVV
jgi:hypothetical protein